MASFPSPAPTWYVQASQVARNGVYYLTTGSESGGGTETPPDPRQATYEADPYNWTFFSYSEGVGAWRRHEGGRIEQTGSTLTQVLDRIDTYEADQVRHGVPVSHEWGQVYGGGLRRKLMRLG